MKQDDEKWFSFEVIDDGDPRIYITTDWLTIGVVAVALITIGAYLWK
jgi:hypothetical protein